jgi:hypothetical protein
MALRGAVQRLGHCPPAIHQALYTQADVRGSGTEGDHRIVRVVCSLVSLGHDLSRLDGSVYVQAPKSSALQQIRPETEALTPCQPANQQDSP